MAWPTLVDFRGAVQDLRRRFEVPYLVQGETAVTRIGIPPVYSGNFASHDASQSGGPPGQPPGSTPPSDLPSPAPPPAPTPAPPPAPAPAPPPAPAPVPPTAPAPAPPPAPGSGGGSGGGFSLDSKLIAFLFLAAFLLAVPGAFWELLGNVAFLVFAFAVIALCFKLKMVTRWLMVALMLLAVALYVPRDLMAEFTYDLGLTVLNASTDPAEREFWPDPEAVDLDEIVVVETWKGIEGFNTTTPEGRAAAISGIKFEKGELILQVATGIVLVVGTIPFALGMALSLMGFPRSRGAASASGRPRFLGRFDRRLVKVSIVLVTIGALLRLFGALTPAILDEFLKDGLGYTRGGGISSENAHLFWPMVVLDKVGFIGAAAFMLGILILLHVFIDWVVVRIGRRSIENLGFGEDEIFEEDKIRIRRIGAVLLVIGIVLYLSYFEFTLDFLIPAAKEIGIATTGNWEFLRNYNEYPGWLRIIITIQEIVWVPTTLLGIICVALPRLILGIIRKVLGKWPPAEDFVMNLIRRVPVT